MNLVTQEQFESMEKVVSVEHLYKLARDKRSVVLARAINLSDGRLKHYWQRIPASFVINMTAMYLCIFIEYGNIRIYPKGGRNGNQR